MKKQIITAAVFAACLPCVPLCGNRTNQPGKHPHCPRQPL